MTAVAVGGQAAAPVARRRRTSHQTTCGCISACCSGRASRARAPRASSPPIRTFARWLRREGTLDSDPAALAASPKREQTIPAHLSIDEMNRLLETPDRATPLGRRDQAILELFYASGLRLSELVGLDLDDLNLNARMVRVLGKGRKERLVPLNQSAADAIRAYLDDRAQMLSAAGTRAAGRAGRAGPRRGRARAGASAVCELPWRAARRAQRPSARAEIRRDVQRALRHLAARAPALVRDAPARARRRPAGDPGDARPRAAQHDAALHAREFRHLLDVYRQAHPRASRGKRTPGDR